MVIKLEDLSHEELVEALGKAMRQISKLVDENNELREKLESEANKGKHWKLTNGKQVWY